MWSKYRVTVMDYITVIYQELFDNHNVHFCLITFLDDSVLSERKGKKAVCKELFD